MSVDAEDDVDPLLAALLGGGRRPDKEDEAPTDTEAPGSIAARGVIQDLVDDGSLVLAEGSDPSVLADKLLGFLEKTDAVGLGSAVADWLVDRKEVDELFGDDNDIEVALRRNFTR